MSTINANFLRRIELSEIERITFYKRDEITTDLICCELEIGGKTWLFHEEMPGWKLLLKHFQKLPGFHPDWFAAVSHPAFEACVTVAYRRH
ncbi:hypothetical protein [Mesorhizobium sp. IMUNJ 23232]|uniref:hypothetical protein n=1 Tax=Mesorhizobium sp. IMUNJ 23232 TaxID=3376064 RepID=UPI0037898DA7